MFTLAHLSDLHLAPLPRPRFYQLVNKRLIGYLSWDRNRYRTHLREVADLARLDVQDMRPDHVVITGDLVNISLPDEFSAARLWLEAFGDPQWITVVPGNHDAYVRVPWADGIGQWAAYMRGDRETTDGSAIVRSGERPFPFLRRRGPVSLIGLSTAVPTLPFRASGRVGRTQRKAIDPLFDALAAEPGQTFRIVLIHHPPFPGQNPARKALSDADALAPVLRRHAPELVLHGHNHREMTAWLAGSAKPVPAIGVASASAGRREGQKSLASYNLYTIRQTGQGFTCDVRVRGYDRDHGRFVDQQSFRLQPLQTTARV